MPKEANLPRLSSRERARVAQVSRAGHDGRALVGVAEAAEYLGTSRTTLRRLIAQGHVRAAKVGGTIKLRPSDLDDYVDHNMVS